MHPILRIFVYQTLASLRLSGSCDAIDISGPWWPRFRQRVICNTMPYQPCSTVTNCYHRLPYPVLAARTPLVLLVWSISYYLSLPGSCMWRRGQSGWSGFGSQRITIAYHSLPHLRSGSAPPMRHLYQARLRRW